MGWFVFTKGVDTTNQLAGLKVDAEDISFTLEEVATATTLTVNHFLVMVNGNVTITLPASASHANRVYTIKNIGTGKVTIDAYGGEKIEWEDKLVLGLQGDYVILTTSGAKINGTEWVIIGGRNVKLEEILDKLLNEQIEKLHELLIEARQQTLHQASVSGENISRDDVQ